MLTDASGAIAWEAHYRPFGDAITTGSLTFNLRFPGQYHDAETGLHYNWHRYYDPQTGRYLTSDPIGLVGGLNPYLYAEAYPTGQIDPMGLYALPGAIYGSISGAVGGYVAGGWLGVIPGSVAGALGGLIVPTSSHAVGAFAGGVFTSMLGQAAANFIQDKPLGDLCSYNVNAALGAGLAGVPARAMSSILAPRLPIITVEVIGRPLGSRVVFRIPGNTVSATIEGGAMGLGEKLGSEM